MFKSILLCLTISLLSTTGVSGQSSYEKLPKLMPSSLIVDIEEYLRRTPGISDRDLAVFANKKLQSSGFEFEVDPCDIASKATALKYPGEEGEVFHIYQAKDVKGGLRSFLAREPGDAPCGCWLNLPVTFVTRRRMVLVSEGAPLEIVPPKELLLEESELVDRTLRRSIRTWVMPQGGPPDGISTDGRKLYLQIGETRLFLEIPDTGTLRIVSRKERGLITRFTDLKKFPADPQDSYLGYRRFSKGKMTFTIKFSHICT